MRLIVITAHSDAEDAHEKIADDIANVKSFAGVDTMGGLLVHNEPYHSDEERRVQLSIDLKGLSRQLGLYFHQPLMLLNRDIVLDLIRGQVRRYGWEGNYLLMPSGWRLTSSIDVLAIDRRLDAGANYIHLPTPADEASWTQEMEAEQFQPIEAEGVMDGAPHFGRFDALLKNKKDGNFVFSNGGRMKAVVAKS